MNQVIERADAFPLSFQEVGEPAKNLPRLFYRDQKLQVDLLQVKLTSALEGLSDFASTKLTDAFSKTLAQYKQAAASAKQDLQERVKALAQTETDENFKIVQKLNLIEIETIQRIHADRELDKNSYTKGKFKQASVDDMVFPDDGQPWMDELDKYQVRVNSCPQDLRRKM